MCVQNSEQTMNNAYGLREPSYDKTRLPSLLPGPEVIKRFSCSTQLCMKLILLINVKMPTTVVILTFM